MWDAAGVCVCAYTNDRCSVRLFRFSCMFYSVCVWLLFIYCFQVEMFEISVKRIFALALDVYPSWWWSASQPATSRFTGFAVTNASASARYVYLVRSILLRFGNRKLAISNIVERIRWSYAHDVGKVIQYRCDWAHVCIMYGALRRQSTIRQLIIQVEHY